MTTGILLNARNHRNVPRDEYDEWYHGEHLPERSRVPGFLSAERWVDVHDPNVSVSVYDLESVAGPVRQDARLRWAAHITAIIPPFQARRIVRNAAAA